MRILTLSDLEWRGGAAIAAARLALGLCRAGHEVTRVVSVAEAETQPWHTAMLVLPLAVRVLRRLLARIGREALIGGLVTRRLRSLLRELHPEVINVHNLHWAARDGWSLGLASACAASAPTVWTLHDMWSFTGRCAYAWECRRFLTGCDASCPTPGEYPPLEPGRIAASWRRRKSMLAAHPGLVAVAPSRWLAAEARAGLWTGHRVEVIPYGLPLDTYRPLGRELARAALGIEPDGPVLLAAASELGERRKGAGLLREALERAHVRPLTLLTLGRAAADPGVPGVRHLPLGFVDHERTRVLAYCAADLLVHPAPVDNLPNVVLEAVACGTPVAALPIGGLPEVVRPGISGWLAEDASAQGLAAAIARAVADLGCGVDLRAPCRAMAEREYGAELQAARYLELFSSLLP